MNSQLSPDVRADLVLKELTLDEKIDYDWWATHSTVKASAAGLDNEQPMDDFFGAKLKEALQSGKIPLSEIDDHVRRILRSEFAAGLIDFPTPKSVVDVEGGFATARRIAEQSTVLLKNSNATLPLDRAKLHSIAIIGPNADSGMISGGGSAQVGAPGRLPSKWNEHIWFPTSPLKAVSAKVPGATVAFDCGKDPAAAAELAKKSDIAIVFASQWTTEGRDLPNLLLPDNQDALIAQVAAANPRTVVLESGTAVTMPWLDNVSAVLDAWFAGSKGADAVANIIFADVNPCAKLPMTFPRSEADLPHPNLVIPPKEAQGHAAVMKSGEAKRPPLP
jgi:beta-glucosidase